MRLEKEDFAFLDWLVKMAIETLIPSAKPTCSLAMIVELGDRTPARRRSRRKAH